MDKIWLQDYPPGVPADISASRYSSLAEFFTDSAKRYWGETALVHRRYQVTYGELYEKACSFAGFLQSLGLQKGDRIALMMPNILAFPVALYGSLLAGLIVVTVNPLYTPSELHHQLQDASPKAIVVLDLFAQTLRDSEYEVPNVVVATMGDIRKFFSRVIFNCLVKIVKRKLWPIRLRRSKKFVSALKYTSFKPVTLIPSDLAFLQYTGGTTGVPKGAMLSHGNLLANIEQVSLWITARIEPGKEIVLTALPMYHIFSLMVNALLFCRFGAMSILITNPKDIPGLIKEIKSYALTAITGVNLLFNALARNSKFAELDFTQLKISLGGGAPVQDAVANLWLQVTKNPLMEGYGLTEASPVVAVNPMTQTVHDGSIGLPLPSTDIKLMREDETECALDEPGELWVKGPQVMQGYWNNPEETAKVLREGWLATGDMATMDARGHLRIVDRKKDMILVSGFNVYPSEIESVIANMPQVLEVAVTGLPAEVSGEQVVAFIVKQTASLTAEEVTLYCRQFLTGYKIPRRIVFLPALPKSTVGKVLRKELKTILIDN